MNLVNIPNGASSDKEREANRFPLNSKRSHSLPACRNNTYYDRRGNSAFGSLTAPVPNAGVVISSCTKASAQVPRGADRGNFYVTEILFGEPVKPHGGAQSTPGNPPTLVLELTGP
ncbi:hypothetical protein KM043_013238 [Ampulex compressa]|nr:hypothetical protein KM043_013238 [Ampulex compressa]